MSVEPHIRRELLELVAQMRDGSVSEAATERLSELIQANDEQAWLYVQAMHLDAGLRWEHCEQRTPLPLAASGPPAELRETDLPRPASHAAVAPLSWGGVILKSAQSLRGYSLITAGVVMFSLALTLAQFKINEPFERGDARQPPPTYQRERAARLTGEASCQWNGAAPLTGATLHAGERLDLHAGVAEITFKDGAIVTLEGPSSFVVENGNCGRLIRGQLVALAHRKVQGFTIETPSATIVDLSTEFAVGVDERRTTEVHVLQGVITIEYGERSAQGAHARREVLHQGQAWRVGGQQGRAIPYEGPVAQDVPGFTPARRFTRQLPLRARVFTDRFESKVHGRYALSQAVGSGGNFEIANGALQLRPGLKNTMTVVLDSPQHGLLPGMSVEVDWESLSKKNGGGQFLMIGTQTYQPDGKESCGFRLRRDHTGISVNSYLPGLLDPRKAPKTSSIADPQGPLTLGIERPSPSTFVFYYKHQETRFPIVTMTEETFADYPFLYIGMQAWKSTQPVHPKVRELRIQLIEPSQPETGEVD